MIEPLHDQIVVRRVAAEATTAAGLVLPDAAREKPARGTVVAVGIGCRDKDGEREPLDVQVGDEILFQPTAGAELAVNGDQFVVLHERDVIGVVET